MVVYVLLFNARTDNEGIHTLRVDDTEDIVLMFENKDDATRFAVMLEAQDFPEATVEAMEQEDIEAFCDSAGYGCKIVPEGSLAIPPEGRVEELDWDPNADPDAAPQPPEAEDSGSTLSQSELDRLRQQFENLL
ncbi:hypothetical protein GFS31_10120 [Leptolyngbya sp. BL0902]|uniref:DUF3110 domain-containing protein n=1 Tax=Leptolyngbya sp. BL0902 TaxID=1115757 RepID=UPI0018E7BF0D|nr:DUF3110 domain-containing protein [Leptolyngbya sp. BL0902]QQE64332.1 hypothetical protein GFS31_10120 [Leptolyngbya sp. BL0902]